ncbi:hypothetical protein T4B_7765 [Trichinella pseudospiralis]|uniref:Uncharacterized protein n=1 Tax=Trichinella pseudospiralis TaxID=6337 RepID=A0A0V1ISA9_TRIPS|nr:hypothetical protein T4B_7765 [Trichinella pseudospiralis]KRZ25559.1 hypothetical protein T4C_2937 [Trichinella pseudospiralis]
MLIASIAIYVSSFIMHNVLSSFDFFITISGDRNLIIFARSKYFIKVSITVVTISDTLHHLFAIKMSAVTCYLSICIIKPLRYSYIEEQ